MKTQHRARKRFGQNFLHEQSVIEQIIQALGPKAHQQIIEIGPGKGALTASLIHRGANLTAIEIDRDLAALLRQEFHENANFKLLEQDVLQLDFNTLLGPEKPARIIGNLPYNISTPLIFHLLDYLPGIADMLFMLQLEVVERMCALPSSKAYGRLSIMCQYYCDVEKLFEVPPQAFSPAPKVTSAIVRLKPRRQAFLEDPKLLETLLRQAFAQRRKTLRNNLQGLVPAEQLKALDIDPGLRPENLSLLDYVRICRWLGQQLSE
jgi:16S rRNA (adenine1518-N6/adenine1519-N6)-dimethyltransferase